MAVDIAERILEVPVIDVGALMDCKDDVAVAKLLEENSPELQQVIENVRAAASEWGFFYIRNHGISDKQMQIFQTAMRDFFKLPLESRKALERSKNKRRGFFQFELTKQKVDWKEGFDVGGPPEEEHNQWPPEDELPGFHAAMDQYYKDGTHIARRLIQVLAVALGERFDFFDQFFHESIAKGPDAEDVLEHTSVFRLNHYPPAPEPEKTMGVYHHTDSGALTVLLQDDEVASLQVFHHGEQQWVLVPPIKDTFVVNVGDMVQVWSNDRFVAALHRVLANGDKERFSAPFFYTPSNRAVVQPIIVEAGEQPHYRPIHYKQFHEDRYNGNVADLGEEIQISHYRIAA